MTCWKMMNAESKSNDYKFVEGLNVDPIGRPLEEVGSCEPGAFYFCEGKNVHKYLSYGTHAREVTLPAGEPVKKDGDKLKARRVICGPLITMKNLLEREPLPDIYYYSLDFNCCDLSDFEFPREVSGFLDLGFANIKGAILPEKIGSWLELKGCSMDKVKMPVEVVGCIDMRGCYLKGVVLPEKVGGWLDLRGCDLKGVVLPKEIGCDLYLTGCDLKGVVLPREVGGKIITG